jgi:hypothetical protein
MQKERKKRNRRMRKRTTKENKKWPHTMSAL